MSERRTNDELPDVRISDAKPYRTPNEVSEEPKRPRRLVSALPWLITGFVIVGFFGALAVVGSDSSPQPSDAIKDVSHYVEDFGDTRRGRPHDEYEREQQAELAITLAE